MSFASQLGKQAAHLDKEAGVPGSFFKGLSKFVGNALVPRSISGAVGRMGLAVGGANLANEMSAKHLNGPMWNVDNSPVWKPELQGIREHNDSQNFVSKIYGFLKRPYQSVAHQGQMPTSARDLVNFSSGDVTPQYDEAGNLKSEWGYKPTYDPAVDDYLKNLDGNMSNANRMGFRNQPKPGGPAQPPQGAGNRNVFFVDRPGMNWDYRSTY